MSEDAAIGFLIGLQHSDMQNDKIFADEKARLRRNLPVLNERLDNQILGEIAQRMAIVKSIEVAVTELEARDAGRPYKPRHSDPNQTAAQVEDFVDTAEGNLKRLSSGELSFTARSNEHARSRPAGLRNAAELEVDIDKSPKSKVLNYLNAGNKPR